MTELKCRIEQWIYRIHQWLSEKQKMKGSWIECESMMICNCCGKHFLYADNDTDEFYFCPNCGADMRERKDENG